MAGRFRLLLAVLAMLALSFGLVAGAAAEADYQQQDTVTKTFKLTLYGTPKKEMTFLATWVADSTSRSSIGFCGPALQAEYTGFDVCKGDGAIYSMPIEGGFPPGTNLTSRFYACSGPCEPDTDIMDDPAGVLFAEGTETINADLINAAWYDFDTGKGGLDNGPGDSQQDDGDHQDIVTKTFRVSTTGTAPTGHGMTLAIDFTVIPPPGVSGGGGGTFVLCGPYDSEDYQNPTCEGGRVYTVSDEFPAGSTVSYEYYSCVHGCNPGGHYPFAEGRETLTSDRTNCATHDFVTATGSVTDCPVDDDQQVPDNQQDDEDTDTDTGAGDDQKGGVKPTVPDNQQAGDDNGTGVGDDQQDEVQDNQQGEAPDKLPDTGAGGLESGATVLVGHAVAVLTMLLGAGYAALRRR